MKLGPLKMEIEVSRDPCRCGEAPVTAMLPVQIGMTLAGPAGITAARRVFDVQLAIDSDQVQRDATAALACRRCEA